MSAPPFMQMYWSDYFGDTRHLSCEQHGAYLQLLGSMWLADGSLPSDPRKLAKITGCTASRWAKICDDVLAFFTIEGDRITHKRVEYELEKAREKSIKRAEAGSRGGTAKSLKTHKADVAIATVLPQHLPEPEPEKKNSEPKGSSFCSPVSVEPDERPPKRSPTGTRLPDAWRPRIEDVTYAAGQNLSPEEIDRVAEDFRDYWIARPGAGGRKSDWPATWRQWVRRHQERRGGSGLASRPAFARGGGSGVEDFATIVARRRGYPAG